ncbi:MAG: chemotaxis-specific protein-glutamate methyltransferase CheB [Planctomycetota bacterium]
MQTLVVDDSRTVRRILRTVLEEAGFEVLEADNGREALLQLDRAPDVGLVVTDWDMPEMDGVTLLKNLRDHPDYRQLPVVMVTQETRAHRIREALQAGATEYIMKPFTRETLLEKLAGLGCSAVTPQGARILVVDDSVIVRKALTERIEADDRLELAGTATNGLEAIRMIDEDEPDLVILDVDMPEMDGIGTLTQLRRRHRGLPVIMFSVLTERGARATLDALSLGAVDYVTKPQGAEDIEDVRRRIDHDLLRKVHAILDEREINPTTPITSRTPLIAPDPDLVVVAASTGGPEALKTMLAPLPANFPVPIVIAQHMPPIFTMHFARRLDKQIQLSVVEASDGIRVDRPGIWIAPGGQETTIERDAQGLFLRCEPTSSKGPKPCADTLFRAAADQCGEKTLGIVLTGMGRDGMLGCAAIAAARGRVLVQDRDSSVVSSMPRAVIESGVVERELSPIGLADLLLEITTRSTETQT